MSSLNDRVVRLSAQLKARDLILRNVFEVLLGETQANVFQEALLEADAQIDAALKAQLDG